MDTEFARWISEALERLGWSNGFEQQPLAVEASFRLFYRVSSRSSPDSREAVSGTRSDENYPDESYVAMYSPPGHENNAQFTGLAEIFASQGVPVPAIRAADAQHGYFLLTDLGTRNLEDAYAENDTEAALGAAIDTLVNIQAVRHRAIPPYEVRRFRDELGIFREWFVEGLLNVSLPDSRIHPVFDALIETTQDQPQCCVHRDFHCRNLLYGRDGRFGVVDFQDALVGPVSYDLASLLRDCYHSFPEPQIAQWRSRFLAATPFELDDGRFAELLDFAAVQRQLKAIGIFSRLHLRDARPSHLPVIVPLLDRLITVAHQYPRLHSLADWLRDIQPRANAVLTGLT